MQKTYHAPSDGKIASIERKFGSMNTLEVVAATRHLVKEDSDTLEAWEYAILKCKGVFIAGILPAPTIRILSALVKNEDLTAVIGKTPEEAEKNLCLTLDRELGLTSDVTHLEWDLVARTVFSFSREAEKFKDYCMENNLIALDRLNVPLKNTLGERR